MNTNDPQKDGPLDAMLSHWQPSSPLPPRFREQVWQRIQRTEAASRPAVPIVAAIEDWIATRLPRPRLAAAYLTALITMGAGVGWSQAQKQAERVSGHLSVRYAQSVDPYQGSPQP